MRGFTTGAWPFLLKTSLPRQPVPPVRGGCVPPSRPGQIRHYEQALILTASLLFTQELS